MAHFKDDHLPQRAADIMTRRLVTVRPETDVADAIKLFLKYKISGIPVVDENNAFHGMFSDKSCIQVLTQTAALAGEQTEKPATASQFMVRKVLKLQPQHDVFDAIGTLIRNRISGAPVTDPAGNFLGVFSEKTSMRVLIESAYEQLPTAEVSSFMNTDMRRTIHEDTTLLQTARTFHDTVYRRLPVVRDRKLRGQISRRDVLRSSQILSVILSAGEESPVAANRDSDAKRVLEAHQQLPSRSVRSFQDQEFRTIHEDTDLLEMAQIFMNTECRQLPVLRDTRVVGQISRRDLLAAFYKATEPQTASTSQTLYLSACRETAPELT